MTKPLSPINVGVDVSKDKLDVHLLERTAGRRRRATEGASVR
jgi:hypothetical protein